jgi:hypothetical protein
LNIISSACFKAIVVSWSNFTRPPFPNTHTADRFHLIVALTENDIVLLRPHVSECRYDGFCSLKIEQIAKGFIVSMWLQIAMNESFFVMPNDANSTS